MQKTEPYTFKAGSLIHIKTDIQAHLSNKENSFKVVEALHPTPALCGFPKKAAHDFIVELPQGYDTILGENGSGLSGGQRQRIAIARALINDPKILIFDEATSALDYESERIIQNNMQEICKGRTVIIIAHRLSAVRVADKIIAMDYGQIVEIGSHHELIAINDGYYRYLHSLQG